MFYRNRNFTADCKQEDSGSAQECGDRKSAVHSTKSNDRKDKNIKMFYSANKKQEFFIMDWEECFKKRIAKDIKEDINLIKSLMENSDNKLISSNELKIDEIHASSKLSLAYDSLREILEAITIKKGFKIYNHECFTALLKEVLNEKEKGEEFDKIRKIRNDINYYGKKITIEEAKDIINRIKKLRKNLIEKYIK